ncbi:hypothetical protein BJY01DRAFT_169190 [Aspergillus pseudoustus]|uniref:Uncharacterized protein n=1 Tax=Aspergillus pseudoustus TaxID=1810923 RepID=A0ABR4K5C9_9EURO
MSSVRFTSALARRTLNSPLPLAAPPCSSALRCFSSASYSSLSASSSSSAFPSTARALASTSAHFSRAAATRSLNRIQFRTMATEGPKIKVKNPVVELDGDEVCFSPKCGRRRRKENRVPCCMLYTGPHDLALCDLYLGGFAPRERRIFVVTLPKRGEKRRKSPSSLLRQRQSSEDRGPTANKRAQSQLPVTCH